MQVDPILSLQYNARYVQINRNQHRSMILSAVPMFQAQLYRETLFSEILIAKTVEKDSQFIIKRSKASGLHHIRNQVEVLTQMQSYEGFPRLYHSQYEHQMELTSIRMQKLGISLKTLIHNSHTNNIKIPVFVIVNLGFQMLDRIEKLHINGYIHNDLKPHHFLFQTNDPSSTLFLIDFGLTVKIEAKQHQRQSIIPQNTKFSGNIAYSSINKMRCRKENVRDDLESLVYIIGEMLEGQLPWKPKSSNQNSTKNWKNTFSGVLSKKLQKGGWKTYSSWINSTLTKIRQKEDPYRQLRKSISFLLQFES